MITTTVVTFDRDEREACQRVLNSIGVGFPDYPYPKGDPQQDLIRALGAVAGNGGGRDMSHTTLARAVRCLERQVAQCGIEATPGYWEDYLLRPAPVATVGGAALIADPHRMCTVLTEAREVQLTEALHALTLVREALSLASPPYDPDEDEDA